MRQGLGKFHAAAVLVAALTMRCASIRNGRYERVDLRSDPPGAALTIDCGPGMQFAGTTPLAVEIPRSAGDCAVDLTRDGYEKETISLPKTYSGKTFANFGVTAGIELATIFAEGGGMIATAVAFPAAALLGALFVGIDHATGAVFSHAPDGPVRITLREAGAGACGAPGQSVGGRPAHSGDSREWRR